MCNVCPLYIPLTCNAISVIFLCVYLQYMCTQNQFTVQVYTKQVYSTIVHKTSFHCSCTKQD